MHIPTPKLLQKRRRVWTYRKSKTTALTLMMRGRGSQMIRPRLLTRNTSEIWPPNALKRSLIRLERRLVSNSLIFQILRLSKQTQLRWWATQDQETRCWEDISRELWGLPRVQEVHLQTSLSRLSNKVGLKAKHWRTRAYMSSRHTVQSEVEETCFLQRGQSSL